MGAETEIAWTDSTFNPWIGCTKVSEGCANCYAAALDHRWGHDRWGPGKKREPTSEAYWQQPLRWNEEAKAIGRRRRVFCASLADVFDLEAPAAARQSLWELIAATPNLDWLLLTKRPENFTRYLPWIVGREGTEIITDGDPWPNVWLGITVENQEQAERRIPLLAAQDAAVRFLSMEPLLEPVDLNYWFDEDANGFLYRRPPFDWIIIGGESGPKARPFNIAWARDLVKITRAFTPGECAPFVKQLGDLPVIDEAAWRAISAAGLPVPLLNGAQGRLRAPAGTLKLALSPKGGNPEEWPADLRVREFPVVRP